MNFLRGLALSVAAFGVACSSSEPVPERAELASSEQAITSGCSQYSVGLPCDPDGSGPLLECEGMCVLRAASGGGTTVACAPLSTMAGASNNGKICGDALAGDCTHYCSGKTCISGNAPDGAACRPAGTTTATMCDGQCKSGACVALTNTEKCPANKSGDCTYDWCSATKSTSCVQLPLVRGSTCNDSLSCTTGDACDGAGKCVGTPKVCPPSGTPCLVNACDPTSATGACIAKPQPGASCADKCNAGTCDASGTCIKGAALLSCDDKNACTTDSCNPATGCVNTPIPGCGDAGVIVDTGVVDTGVVIKDTGVVPVDTGVVPVDTGVVPVDTGVAPVEDSDILPPEDTGSTTTEDTGSTSASDADLSETGDDGGLGFEETVEKASCGCRTTPSSGAASYAGLSLVALGLAVARRRRR